MFKEDFVLENYWIIDELSTKTTGLPVSMYLFNDEFGNNDTPRLSIIPDVENHTFNYKEHLLISISDTPKILDRQYTKFNINGSQLAEVFSWIRINKTILLDYWFQKISGTDLRKNLILLESPNILKNETNLDVNIYISHDANSTKHNEPRIKIQNNNNKRVNRADLIPV